MHRPVLANAPAYEAIKEAENNSKRWRLLAGVLMPDHVHCVVTSNEDRGLSAGDFATGFKRMLGKELRSRDWEWQRGCFDRLLRSDESLQAKWIYLEQNPVRAGLVESVADWPYYLGSIAEQGSWQLPLQKKEAK